MNDDKTALIVFAREPAEGKVKTRLAKNLSAQDVARLYTAFVKDVLAVAQQARCDQRFIFYAADDGSIPFLKAFEGVFTLQAQYGNDLGERMLHAFSLCQNNGFNRVVIIGTDCLTLSADDIELAFSQLGQNDCVLGPSRDGGYYLIGLKEPDPRIFQGIEWSTDKVLSQTCFHLKAMQKQIDLLSEREDIDSLVHLQNFCRGDVACSTAPETRKILENIRMEF